MPPYAAMETIQRELVGDILPRLNLGGFATAYMEKEA
jgi:hypothetical protein